MAALVSSSLAIASFVIVLGMDIESTGKVAFLPNDPSPFAELGELSAESSEVLGPIFDLDTGASENIYSVRELFRRRRKPIANNNATAANILLDKIRNAQSKKYFDPSTAADALRKRRKKVKYIVKQTFKPRVKGFLNRQITTPTPVDPEETTTPEATASTLPTTASEEVETTQGTVYTPTSVPYTFSSFPDVNLAKTTPFPELVQDFSSEEPIDLDTEASTIRTTTLVADKSFFKPSPTIGDNKTFQPSTLTTILEGLDAHTPALTIVTPTSVEPIEDFEIVHDDQVVEPSQPEGIKIAPPSVSESPPSVSYVAPPPVQSTPSPESAVIPQSELAEQAMTTMIPDEVFSTYPTEEVPVSNDQDYFDLEKLITDSGGRLQETPKIRRKVAETPPQATQGEFLNHSKEPTYEDDPVSDEAEAEEDPFYATKGFLDLKKLNEEPQPVPQEATFSKTILVSDPEDEAPRSGWVDLDSNIIKSIEEVLHIDIPLDSKLLYRDSSPRFTRTHRDGQTTNQNRNGNDHEVIHASAQAKHILTIQLSLQKHAYGFSYSVFDENTGLTHAREESGDENGVVTGSYEVLEADCTIRRVTYRADDVHGFDVLNIEKIPCSDEQRRTLEGSQKPSQTSSNAGNHHKVQSFQATYGMTQHILA
eukprot:snap_masked-scaffold608_size125128-processed-gene-0.5 protein:Tk06792 transcript:snap_masked-scaffold608_size125128-processed-gene-0.5-mRNA-1 annotation:"GK10226"